MPAQAWHEVKDKPTELPVQLFPFYRFRHLAILLQANPEQHTLAAYFFLHYI